VFVAAVIAKTRSKPKRRSRAEAKADSRAKLIAAAAQIIGKDGYADCSVSKITMRAGVAQGTFYTYFESRQQLFDLLLPELGEQMLHYIGARLKGIHPILDREEQGLWAFIDFHQVIPGFHRILAEAHTIAPRAYDKHVKRTTEAYLNSLRVHWTRGDLPGYTEDELELLAIVLMSFRSYYGARCITGKGKREQHSKAVEVFMKFLHGGLTAAVRKRIDG
jgi:AcrR family transcriptional regulator